jgi:conjugal transfer pilus assembly protein TraB
MSDANQSTKRRQQLLSGVGFAVILVLAGLGLIFAKGGSHHAHRGDTVKFTGVGDQNDRNAWRAQSEAQIQQLTEKLSAATSKADDAQARLNALARAQDDLKKQLDAQKDEQKDAQKDAHKAASAADAASSVADPSDRTMLNKALPLKANARQPSSGSRLLNSPFSKQPLADGAPAAAPSLDIIRFDPAPGASGDDCVDPRFSAQPATDAQEARKTCVKGAKRKGVTFIPATSFVRVFMMNGVDAPTGGEAQHDPLPVFLQVLDPANLPNLRKLDIRGCRLITAAYGDVSSERTHMRGETLSCILNSGKTVEMTIKGNVIGEDGKEGVRGRLVSKAGSALAMSVLSGISQGIGQAFNQSAQTVSNTALGATSFVNPSQVGRAAIGSGVAQGAKSLQEYYIRAAEKLFPVIETDGGRVVEFAVTKGAVYDGAPGDVSDMNDSLDSDAPHSNDGYSDD